MTTPVLTPSSAKSPHVHPDHIGIDIDRTDDLCALLVQIAQDVLAHLAAAVLNHSDPFHKNTSYHDLQGSTGFPLSPAAMIILPQTGNFNTPFAEKGVKSA